MELILLISFQETLPDKPRNGELRADSGETKVSLVRNHQRNLLLQLELLDSFHDK